ncbi:hypothetical protein HID58_060185, partial [Brassica napus]
IFNYRQHDPSRGHIVTNRTSLLLSLLYTTVSIFMVLMLKNCVVVMAPEYAMEGIFGVLILEIVTGSKNVSFRGSEHGSLIGYAWNLWSQGKTKELIDPTVKDTQDVNEAMRCIHVGMLCTRDSVIYRPNISSVLLMLESRIIHLPRPRKPTFHSFLNTGEIVDGQDVATVNDITLTTVVGR